MPYKSSTSVRPTSIEDWKGIALAYAFVADQLRQELDRQLGFKRAFKRALFRIIVKIMVTLG